MGQLHMDPDSWRAGHRVVLSAVVLHESWFSLRKMFGTISSLLLFHLFLFVMFLLVWSTKYMHQSLDFFLLNSCNMMVARSRTGSHCNFYFEQWQCLLLWLCLGASISLSLSLKSLTFKCTCAWPFQCSICAPLFRISGNFSPYFSLNKCSI